MTRGRRRRWLIAGVILIGPVLVGGFVVWRSTQGNFAVVEPGAIYRSAQLSPSQLRDVIKRHGIRTVINLRGPNPSENWYRSEVATTLAAGASQVDIPLASDQYLSRFQARTLLDTLENSDRPVLIHCQFGAERTGLACAIVELLQPDRTLDDAKSQFSVYYLFLPVQDGKIMIGHLQAYEQWLESGGREHRAELFRHWLAEEYAPGSPSREEWPYDPYPLRLVTGPAALPR